LRVTSVWEGLVGFCGEKGKKTVLKEGQANSPGRVVLGRKILRTLKKKGREWVEKERN